jgi:hypothetical protein
MRWRAVLPFSVSSSVPVMRYVPRPYVEVTPLADSERTEEVEPPLKVPSGKNV